MFTAQQILILAIYLREEKMFLPHAWKKAQRVAICLHIHLTHTCLEATK